MNKSTVLLAAIALAACGGSDDDHPTAEEAGRRILGSYCARLESCLGSAFTAAYPTVDDCVNTGLKAIPEDKRDQPDACTNAEVDTCVEDLETMQCPTSPTAALPASCRKC
ncbi:MAG: hypothetical protein JW940_36830 [Polyangiaceae bacterium]|nr:hypothetical protein [Polyangiaceae bacterium]